MCDIEVGDTDVPNLGLWKLLQLAPGVKVVDIGVCNRGVGGSRSWVALFRWGGRAWPVHKVEVDILDTQAVQAGGETLLNVLVPCVIELGGDPDLLTWNTGVLDS